MKTTAPKEKELGTWNSWLGATGMKAAGEL